MYTASAYTTDTINYSLLFFLFQLWCNFFREKLALQYQLSHEKFFFRKSNKSNNLLFRSFLYDKLYISLIKKYILYGPTNQNFIYFVRKSFLLYIKKLLSDLSLKQISEASCKQMSSSKLFLRIFVTLYINFIIINIFIIINHYSYNNLLVTVKLFAL